MNSKYARDSLFRPTSSVPPRAVPSTPYVPPPQEELLRKEENKRVKAILEENGKSCGADLFGEALAEGFKEATEIVNKKIEEVFREIRRCRTVELCFLVDATGSMDPYIDGVRTAILKIVESLTVRHNKEDYPNGLPPAQDMRLSVVAYRDYESSPEVKVERLEVLQFTRSSTAFKSFCQKLDSTGGDDGPEDVFGGIDAALKLDWSPNAGTRVIFHIADYPCHGNEFHSQMRENYPAGDPKGLKHTELFSRLRSYGIKYIFGKITHHTDLMIKKFSGVYGEPIVEFDVKNVETDCDSVRDKISASVIKSVKDSISSSISSSMRTFGTKGKERKYVLSTTEPSWDKLPTFNGTFSRYLLPKDISEIKKELVLRTDKPKRASIKVAPNPFAKGAERLAYYGVDMSTYKDKDEIKAKEESMVLKESLYLGKGMNSTSRYDQYNQQQTIASFLAQEFVKELDGRGIKKSFKFIKLRIVAITSGTSTRFMSVERRFAPEDKFIRFSNNAEYSLVEEKALALGVSMDLVQLVIAFSHWTYKVTNRFLMVVDLEGIVVEKNGETSVFLTDPAIHCTDVTRFRPMNLGLEGMKMFFQNHRCNQFCKSLGLYGVDAI